MKLCNLSSKNTHKTINGILTDVCNGRHVTINQQKFLRDAIKINVTQRRPFYYHDFDTMTPGNFRQMIHKLKDVIEIAYKTNPCAYRIRGTPWPKRTTLTKRPTGDRMIDILQQLKEQPAKIHDIKLKAYSNLHSFITDKDMNPDNHSIKVKIPLDQHFHSTILIYPSVLQIDIACTSNPIVYDVAGAIYLTGLLGQLYARLQYLSSFRASISPLMEWIVTHYHFGVDGSEHHSGQSFHLTYDDFATGLVRFYSKKIGETWMPRLEQIQTPKLPLVDEIDKIIASHNQAEF
ncbi:MAG: hypothetical protein QXN55_02175 [Candidatus Nitrosotenuis sp.]